jgi:DNA-binding FrmR family transcriptional regulator
MSHTIHSKEQLLVRARRVRAQFEQIEGALDREAGGEVLHLLARARAATARLMADVLEDHVLTNLVDLELHPEAFNPEAAEHLLAVVRTYLR